jgi:hypothetical protein
LVLNLADSFYLLQASQDLGGRHHKRRRRRNNTDQTDGNLSSDNPSDTERTTGHTASASVIQQRKILGPEFIKLAVSYVYMFVVFMLTAFVMVVVHDRVPDMDRYPPLPDIVLDNLPYIPWAFELCELTAVSMSLALSVILLLHKHRYVTIFATIRLSMY